MDTDLAHIVAKGIIRIVIDFPLTILLIRVCVLAGFFEWAGWKAPTIRQTLLIAFALVFLTTH